MNFLRKMSRRGIVRTVSFALALIAALSAAAIGGYTTARKYRTTLEYSYQRALGELTDYLSNIDITLEKGQYAATSKQLQGLSSKLWREAGNAKIALNQLPLEGEQLNATYKFLSQVGNFCVALSDKVGNGGTISEEERAALDQLAAYASSLALQLGQMESDLENGALTLRTLQTTQRQGKTAAVNAADGQETELPNIAAGFREMEEGFTDYPTLIYDGPFSDHIQQQKPKFLTEKAAVSAEQALSAAQRATGASGLSYAGETNGTLPCYLFTAGDLTVSVTQAGGVPDYFLNARAVGEPVLSVKEGLKAAEDALEERDLGEFAYRYYQQNNGVLLVNFAALQNGAVCYPDLVKVGIALDTGEVISYDAKGYIQNHTVREFPDVSLSEEQARAVLSTRLTPEAHAMAFVPSKGLSEVYCHEFLCRGRDGEQVLVYIDAQTGMEEQILILLEEETGVLAM